MGIVDHRYLEVLSRLVNEGELRDTRSGEVYSLFGHQMRFDLSDEFPLLTTKRVHFKSVLVELLWFLRGDTNIKFLNEHGVTIWDEWANENGDLGPVYAHQWRYWRDPDGGPASFKGGIDQITNVIDGLKNDPFGRRHIVSAWNVADIEDMALPPCHLLFQFFVSGRENRRRLSCHLYQRSADWFLGVPFNIASYALLTHLIAREVSMAPGDLVMSFGDYHLYKNHLAAASTQLQRKPYFPPNVIINAPPDVGIFDLRPEHIELHNYRAHDPIKAEVSK